MKVLSQDVESAFSRVFAGFDPQGYTGMTVGTRRVPTASTGWDAGSSPAGHGRGVRASF